MSYLIAIDQGTSSTRVVLFTTKGEWVHQAQCELTQYYPLDGWVEHCAEEIWQSVLSLMQQVVVEAGIAPTDIKACGITNQRETTVLWDKKTGEVVHRAIVWQDRRTEALCDEFSAKRDLIQQKTGLVLDPYFSATKIHWLLNHSEKAAALLAKDELAFGTIDTFLLWRLTKGKTHATDITNASRTMLYNIHHCEWDQELLSLFSIPSSILPVVKDCDAHFGVIDKSILGHEIPITGVVGDQQAATIGQACFKPGMVKATYGTGCFLLLNTGDKVIKSSDQLLTTIAYRLKGEIAYGLEGSLFNAGTGVKWLRDQLGLITAASETSELAGSTADNGGVYMVPAFTGLGAPYWDGLARGTFVGMQLSTSKAHLVRAVLEAVCYQTQDVLSCMKKDFDSDIDVLRVDGGMVVNHWLLQFLANACTVRVEKPIMIESTVWGAAATSALGAGLYDSLARISEQWALDTCFEQNESVTKGYFCWLAAVKSSLVYAHTLSELEASLAEKAS